MKIFKISLWLVCISLLTTNISNAQKKRPNIVLIMADDLGFSDIASYGGEIQTPNINSLAKEGLKFKQFYNGARCCPSRASLMTGLYAHQAGMGWMAAADLGTPAYQGNLNNTSVTIAEVLKSAGYSTYMSGKWHLTLDRKTDGQVKDNWPIQRGFERYFGIVPGGANYFTPTLYSNNEVYKAPKDFYLTDAISDTTVKFIAQHEASQKDKPFFMYVAYTAPHWPLHALQKDINKYKELYKVGWDSIQRARFNRQKELGLFDKNTQMNGRDSEVPAWSDIPEDKKEEMAMRMAIYAAQVDVMDQGIGRIIAELKQTNQLDNTLIFFLSDNGACAEFISSGESKAVTGEQNTFESYRIDWANVSSTPFKEYKHFTYEGGIASPLVVHWPAGIKKSLNNSWVSDYGHIIDIMATCVDVSGATYPKAYNGYKITPMEGKSLANSFKGIREDRGQVFWEHEANIALRDGKWKLVAKTKEDDQFDKASLRLYDLENLELVEMHDLSKKYPEQVEEMYQQWLIWANRVEVFPMDTREYGARMADYKRQINGEFNDNLGGWNIHKSSKMDATVEIDETGKVYGKKSALVSVKKQGASPADLSMNWGFKAKKGEQFQVDFSAIANKNTNFFVRLEKAGPKAIKMIDQQFKVDTKVNSKTMNSIVLPEDGNYRLSLYFGTLKDGDKVWVDQIKLTPTIN